MTATEDLLAFAAAGHRLPGPARDAARHLLADTLAVGAAGANSAEAGKLLTALHLTSIRHPGAGRDPSPDRSAKDETWEMDRGLRRGDEEGKGTARLLGTAHRADPQTAVLWNGFAVHCLEWDAVHEPAVVHALSVVTATLLALIDERGGVDEDEALEALAVGVDLASGLGVTATGAMRFFRPATAGIIGAALAGARIAGLPKERFADVLGLAYSQAAGTMQAHVEASVALPLQIGLAARGAVTAVHLARAGLGGPHDVLEGAFGYSALYEPLDLTRYRPGERWLIEEVSVKPFPSGRASHGVLGTLEALVAGREACEVARATSVGSSPNSYLEGREVAGLTASVPPLIHRLVARPWKSGMEEGYARLCLPFLAALMLRDGLIDPRKFTAAEFANPVLAEIARRVEVVLDDNPDPNALGPQRLVIELEGGETIERTIRDNLGSPAAPMSSAQTEAKLALARAAAGDGADPAIFDDPLGWFRNGRDLANPAQETVVKAR